MILWIIAVLIGYFVKGVAGIGNTLVVTSMMSYTRTNADITPVELLLCTPSNMALAYVNRRAIDWKLTLPALVMVLAGDIVGVALLANVDAGAMKLIFGVALVLLGIEALWREYRRAPESRAHPAFMTALGVAAGTLCGMFGVGALLAAYLSRSTKEDATYKGSMCFIFAVENLFRMVAYGVTGLLTAATLRNTAILFPFMAAGFYLGMKCAGRLNVRTVKLVVNILLTLSGVSLLAANL